MDFGEKTRVNPMALVDLVQSEPQTYRLINGTRLRFDRELPEPSARQAFVDGLLRKFGDAVDEAAA